MSANATPTLPDVETALGVIMDGVHKRAFLGRLRELGHVPQTEKEADALVQLGFNLAAAEADPLLNKRAEQAAQPGPYATALQDLNKVLGVPKQASAEGDLDDVSVAGAYELARDPTIFTSALVLKQAQEAALAAPATEPEQSPETAPAK
jgi:hypothetical protein